MVRANWLDRAIGVIAPGAAMNRVRNRAALEVLTRGYDGAKKSRLTHSWNTGASSADAEIARAGPILRERMRDLERNNPHAANAVSVLVANIIGDGIVPRAKTGDKAKDKRINELFDKWSQQCDAEGELDVYGIQALMVRGMIVSGDGLVRRRSRRASDGLRVPLQLQVIETDLLDSARNGVMPNGNIAVQGVEHDAVGRRSAYWMFSDHPGNGIFNPRASLESKAVPASEILHIYEKQRTQVRGVPWGSPVVTSLRDLGTYEEAELVRKKLESCMVGVLTGTDDGGLGLPLDDQPPGIYDQHGMVEKFEPGMFAVARGGSDIKFNHPASTGSYEGYKRASLHTIAAGFRMPYSLLSGDLSQVNYSSTKVGLEAFRRLISMTQWQLVIPMLCRPLWSWFCEAAYLAGEVDSTDIPAEWTPPRFYSADPLKDVNADIAEVRAGFKTPQEAIASRGWTPDEVISGFAEWNAMIDAAGVILDSDPRKVSGAGQMQQQEEAAQKGDTKDE